MITVLKSVRLSDWKFLAVQLLFLTTFGLAALAKFQTPLMPDSFVEQFRHTWMVNLPGGLFTPYYLIALGETALFFVFLISLVRFEFASGRTKTFLKYGLILSLFIFVILAYGLRLTSQFQGTANAFFYFGTTLLSLWIVEKEEGKAPPLPR
ncbi:MAG: hypothetical protein EA364_08010 [Balneolaceae bacterium]|nr:MAG: hypothetical protein EA364_08010 [Balneolaceae bacterium]